LERESITTAPAVWNDPAPDSSGDVRVRLGVDGRLVSFEAVPPQVKPKGGTGAPADWPRLLPPEIFGAATWIQSEPAWNPRNFADSQAAWSMTLPGADDVPLRVEAAAYGGRLVDVQVVGPWSRPSRAVPAPSSAGAKVVNALLAVLAV